MHLYQEIENQFVIIVVYVDDLNLVGTPEEIPRTGKYLRKEFEIKDLGKTKIFLDLQIEHSLLEFWSTNQIY